MSLASHRQSSLATVRASTLLYPVLATPAVLLLLVTAAARRDLDSLVAAVVLLGAATLAGALTGVLTYILRPSERNVILAFATWAIVLAAPVAIALVATSVLGPRLPDISAWADTLHADEAALILLPTGIVATLLLAVRITGNQTKPVVLRHRRGIFTDRTIVALMALVFVAVVAQVATKTDRFPPGEGDALRALLPQLEREAARHPNHFLSQYRLGNALTRLDECNAALPPLQRAVQLDSLDGWAENDLGHTLNCLRRYHESIVPFRTAVRVMPNESRPRYGLAWALEQTGDWRAAQEEYHDILVRAPNDAVAMAREAVTRYNGGDRDEGLSELRRALAADDSAYWVQLSAAQLFSSSAQLTEAERQYARLAARDSTNVWMWAQYASTSYLAGDLTQARRAFEHLDAVAPTVIEQVPEWRAMRDAARKGTPPSKLPPIAPATGKPVSITRFSPTR